MENLENNEQDVNIAENLDIDEIKNVLVDYEEYPDKSQKTEEEIADGSGKQQQKTILAYLHDFVFGLVGILLVLMLVFRVVVVSGPSMKQTLKDGDCLILLGNLFYKEPQPGDIVVASKDSFKDGEPIIKRVIATEGQEVNIDFVSGIVYVDGVALDEPYTNTPTNLYEGVKFPLIVDEGCVFVMGDNRNDSKDSRSHEIGLIDCREILGKALFIAFPGADQESGKREFDRIGALW